jgi:uncharacterized protein YbjT (DUF2867 family)
VIPILVTGATGNIGRELVAQLRAAGRTVRALTRNPQSAHLPRDVEVVAGDLSAPDTLNACLEGIDDVFLVWVAQPNALRAVHAGVDQLIETSGLRWTVLRPGVFALNCVNWWRPQIASGNVVRWFYADAETAPIHERDIAAVAARVLCEDGQTAAITCSPGRSQ